MVSHVKWRSHVKNVTGQKCHKAKMSQGKAAMFIFYSRFFPHIDVFFVLHVGMIGVAFGEARLEEQTVLCV